ncbi:MAG: MATE family efflux transporter [Dehalococcoidales bacterium]|jgi:putative MATE family efflux protein|nr:MATE family efflux transporter [Dehalococcoidales bacterium]
MRNKMNDQRQTMLATESIGKLLLKMSLPAGIGMFVMSLYNVVDTIFIGRMVGQLGIAGLTVVFPVQMIVMGLGMIVGIGGASIISRSIGAGDVDRAERTLGNCLFSVILIGMLIPAVGLPNIASLLKLFGSTETILPFARSYLDIILLGTFFQVFAMGIGQLIRAEGNARVPMIGMVIGAGLNIILDAVFIVALDMGVRGAAMATILSQAVTSLYVIHYYLFQNSTLKIHLKDLAPDGRVLREIIAVGMGSFFRTTGGSLVAVVILRNLRSHGGDLAIASYGLVIRLMMFLFMPLVSIGQGLQPILGFSYGAGTHDRSFRAIKLATVSASVLSVLAFLLVYLLSGPMFRIFTTDEALVAASTVAARLIFLAGYLLGFQMIGSVVFQTLGKPVPTFLTATSRQVLFLLPLVFILPKYLGINGIWYSFPIADALSSILTLGLLIPEIRSLRKARAGTADEEVRPQAR